MNRKRMMLDAFEAFITDDECQTFTSFTTRKKPITIWLISAKIKLCAVNGASLDSQYDFVPVKSHAPSQCNPIICNIFRHTDEATLNKLRNVCRSWNQEACIALRQLKTVELTSIKSLQDYIYTFQPTFETFRVFPHSKYKFTFRIDQIQGNPLSKSSSMTILYHLIDDFLENFGSFINYCQVPIRAVHFEVNFLDQVLRKLPNIRKLSLHIEYLHQHLLPIQLSDLAIQHLKGVHSLIIQIDGLEVSEDKTTELLSLLFLYLPNLQQISYPGDIRRISKVGLFLRDVILESETSNFLANLCEWEFKTRLLEEHCLQLLCKEFPIKSLYIDLYNPEDDQDCVNSDIMAGLMRKWNKTLNHVEIEFPFRKEISFHFHFPLVMENLKILYLGGFEGCLLGLLKNLKNLSTLELSQCELISILPKPDETNVNLNVNKLRLDFCSGQTAGIISRFSRIFPNLQNLNLNHATNEVVRVIFQKMKCLTKLTLQGDNLTDAGMCGFSEYETKEKDYLLSISTSEGHKFRKYAYIADLKELNYLNLDAFGLTEVTVRHGLVHCRSLRLVKMDCTAGGGDSSTVSRKFRLSEYENHLVEEGSGREAVVELKEEPPMDDEALAFFKSHDQNSDDLSNL